MDGALNVCFKAMVFILLHPFMQLSVALLDAMDTVRPELVLTQTMFKPPAAPGPKLEPLREAMIGAGATDAAAPLAVSASQTASAAAQVYPASSQPQPAVVPLRFTL